MTNKQLKQEDNMLRLRFIFDKAKRDVKGNYSVYNYYKRGLEELELSPKEYEQSVRELARILRV